MISIWRAFLSLLGFNVLVMLLLYLLSYSNLDSSNIFVFLALNIDIDSEKTSHLPSEGLDYTMRLENKPTQRRDDIINNKIKKVENETLELHYHSKSNLSRTRVFKNYERNKAASQVQYQPLVDTRILKPKFQRETNPFYLLGAYPKVVIPVPYSDENEKENFNEIHYGLFNDDDYCERADYYHLGHPENLFENKNFFTDYGLETVIRKNVISQLGRNTMPEIIKYGKASRLMNRAFHFDVTINMFFVSSDQFHRYHEIGKNFLCATQIYSKIPGTRVLIRKDDFIEGLNRYIDKFESKPDCVNKSTLFPLSYRLYKPDECEIFFNKINSKEYEESLKSEPIQYIIKVGHASHSGDGVYLLDDYETNWLNNEYDQGKRCMERKKPLLAQTYISNPLLLNSRNKFDIRVFMLIASTNPLIVYYHDGFLRVALSDYDRFSNEREKHLTNTHIASRIFDKAKEEKMVDNMTEQELRDNHIWSFQRLEKYLIGSAKTTDPKWLENHLRPQFQKAIIHLVKISSRFYLKQSNLFGLYGLDFLLDDNLNLWFIEANPNPQMIATSEFLGNQLETMLRSLLEIEYGLYRSRMKRVFKIIEEIFNKKKAEEEIDYENYKKAYQQATFNRFESEYNTSRFNTFTLIMDEGRKGKAAYFDIIDFECILDAV